MIFGLAFPSAERSLFPPAPSILPSFLFSLRLTVETSPRLGTERDLPNPACLVSRSYPPMRSHLPLNYGIFFRLALRLRVCAFCLKAYCAFDFISIFLSGRRSFPRFPPGYWTIYPFTRCKLRLWWGSSNPLLSPCPRRPGRFDSPPLP